MALEGFTIGGSDTAAPAAPVAAPASGGTALKGFSIGTPAAPAAAPVKAAAPAEAPVTAPNALKGFTTMQSATLDTSGSKIADNVQSMVPKVTPPDTSSMFSKFLGLNKMPAQTPVTSGVTTPSLAKGQKSTDPNSIGGVIDNTLGGLPDASDKVSSVINDTLIKKPADLLANTNFIKESAAGSDAGSVSGNFAEGVLKKLSAGLQSVSGVTGGAYKTPAQLQQEAATAKANKSAADIDPAKEAAIDQGSKELDALKAQIDAAQKNVDPTSQKSIDAFNAMVDEYNTKADGLQSQIDEYNGTVGTAKTDAQAAEAAQGDWLDKTLSTISQAIGFGAGITAIGGIAVSGAKAQAAIAGLSDLTEQLPLVGKYIAPYMEGLVSMAAGAGIESQFDPKLGANLKARASNLAVAVGTAPLYTALGAIKSPLISLPASFGLGYGMAKLSGASNQDAVSSGLAFSLLDAFGRAGESRGFTAEEINQKLNAEAIKVLQPYSSVKLTADSSIEDIKAAYYKAAHQTHPDVGGTADAFSKVSSAYDFLSKGAISKAGKGGTEAEQSVKALSGEIGKSVEKNGPMATHQAVMDNLGVDEDTASRLVSAATSAHTEAEQNKAIDEHINTQLAGRTDEEITSQSVAHVDKNIDSLTDDYLKEHGNVVGADEAKELIPGYSADRSASDLVQRAAGKIADNAYNRLLNTKQGEKNNTVLITAGGTGAGKSTALSSGGYDAKTFPVVYDTNLSNAKGGIKRIQDALDKGFNVHLVYVSTPVREAYRRVLGRSEEMARKYGSGRPVSAQGHIDMHHGSIDALPGILSHKFKYDGKQLTIDILDNAGKNPQLVENNLDFINKLRDNKEDENELHQALNQERVNANLEGRISDQTNAAFARAEKLRPKKNNNLDAQKSKESSERKAGGSTKSVLNRGFVNPEQIAKDTAAAIKRVQDTIKELENVRELSGDIRDAGYQHENKRVANRQRLINLANDVGNMLDANGWNDLYHYDENSDEQITPAEKAVYEGVIKPLKDSLSNVITEYKTLGGQLDAELFFMENEGYTPRFAKDKGGAIDKIIDDFKALGSKAKKTLQNGGLLSKSLGTVDKSRKFFALTDEKGNRTVAHVPTNKSQQVLGFNKGKINELGTPKMKKNEAVLNEQIKPFQEKIKSLQTEVDTLQSVKAGSTGIEGKLAEIKRKALDLDVRFLDTPDVRDDKTLSKDTKALKTAIRDIKLLSKVKPAETIILRDQRINTLRTKMAEASNAMAAIEDTFNPDALNQRVFVDKEGNRYQVGQATTKEIEANTKVRYHTNVLANYLVAIDRATNALNAMRLLDRIKNEEEFGDIIRKDNPDEATPDGWKSVGDILPQFRGYHLEPRAAEVLTDLANRQKGQMHIPVVDEINNFLVGAIVFNPVMHVPNVIAGRSTAASALGVPAKTLANLQAAINEVKNAGPLYLSYLEHGAPFMALKGTTKNFTDAILNQYTDEIENETDPGFLAEHEELAKILGYTNPAALARGIKHINETATWGSNDALFMHALLDYKDVHGGTMEEAIKAVSKYMADYRIPERIFLPGQAGRVMSQALQSRAFLFGRFHYTGVIKPWLEAAKDSAGPNSSGKQRLQGLRALAYMLAMGLIVWPYINKMWQGITGSPTSYESMPGPFRPIQVAEKGAQQGVAGIPNDINSIFTVSPTLRSMIELGFNTDLFTRNPIYGQLPAEGLSAYGTSVVSPLASASRMNPGDFALSLFGIWTPKNVPAKTTLTTMKYDELPALQTQVKKDIAAGNQAKANAEMAEFNTRAIATWNQYELQTGGTDLVTTDAQKQAFLKEYGIKEPGAVALAHANTLYGDGSLTNKSSLISNIATYAKAVGVSPAEAFHLIFSGQTIAKVDNFSLFGSHSAIIVQRAPLSYTEPIKQSQEAAQGKTDQNSTLELDHVIPLEAGGSNDEGNLNLITTAQNMGEQHTFENALGAAVKDGKITQAQVREYSIRYKVGQGETLPDAYMKEFEDKYGGKTMTLQEVEDAIAGK